MAQRRTAATATKTGNGHVMGHAGTVMARSPYSEQRGRELQAFGTIAALPNGLEAKKLEPIVDALNQLLADTMALRDMYKKHHWQVSGPTFYQLHLLFDKHYEEQVALVDLLAERVQLLGGI